MSLGYGGLDATHMAPAAWRRRLPAIVLIGFALVFALGVAAFLLALRPCRLSIAPGDEVIYDLTCTVADLRQDGSPGIPRSERLRLILVGTGDGEICQEVFGPDGTRRDLALLSISSTGSARLLDQDLRPQPAGRAVGFFDLNLLPLPDGTDQAWKSPLSWAALPAAQGHLRATIRRTRSGAAPEFRLTVDGAIEWVAEGSERQGGNRYRQIRNLVCDYRFNTVSGIYERAALKLTWSAEPPDGETRIASRALTYDLVLVDRKYSKESAALRAQAVARSRAGGQP